MKIRPIFAIDPEAGTGEFLDEVPADAQFIVVPPLSVPLILPDNLIDQCASCGCAVQRRPITIPEGVPLVCMACTPDWVAAMEATQ